MSKIVDRIGLIIENKGISVRKFEIEIGASNGSIGRAISKGTDISASWLSIIIERFPEVDSTWLLTGEGSMLKKKSEKFSDEKLPPKTPPKNSPQNIENSPQNLHPNPQNAEALAIHTEGLSGIPLIPVDAVAGVLSGGDFQVQGYECERYVVPMFKGADFLIPVSGDSMEPKYFAGDIVACKCLNLDTFFQWNKVYVVDSEQGVIIKRIRKGNDAEHLLFVSENKEYDPFSLHRAEIRSLAIVLGVIRRE